MVNKSEQILSEVFKTIDIIADKKINDTPFTQTISGRIIERIQSSDMYKITYQNEEIRALAMGGSSYNQGDVVYILVPDKRMDNLKFILGRTNDRTPTITASQTGELSPEILAEIQKALEAINDIASDNKITPSEKTTLAIQWSNLQNSYAEVLNQAADYPDIDTTALQAYYSTLQGEMDIILADMSSTTDYNGDALRALFNNYYGEDQSVRTLILNAIKDSKQYKVEIVSSNGTQFINGEIGTTLTAIVYKGTNNISATLPASSFRWKKTDHHGNPDIAWNTTHTSSGSSVDITASDMIGRATFTCEINID